MEVSSGSESKTDNDVVCILRKALYRLKQSPRAWFKRFTKVMFSMGHRKSQDDQ